MIHPPTDASGMLTDCEMSHAHKVGNSVQSSAKKGGCCAPAKPNGPSPFLSTGNDLGVHLHSSRSDSLNKSCVELTLGVVKGLEPKEAPQTVQSSHLQRRARISLFDTSTNRYAGGVCEVGATLNPKTKFWNFGQHASKIMVLAPRSTILQVADKDNLVLLVEFMIAKPSRSSKEFVRVSCGWASVRWYSGLISLAQDVPLNLVINAGSTEHRSAFDPKQLQRKETGFLGSSKTIPNAVFEAKASPLVRLPEATRSQFALLASWNNALVLFRDVVDAVVIYRQLLATRTSTQDAQQPQQGMKDPFRAIPANCPALTIFPKLLEDPNFVEKFSSQWAEAVTKLSKVNRENVHPDWRRIDIFNDIVKQVWTNRASGDTDRHLPFHSREVHADRMDSAMPIH